MLKYIRISLFIVGLTAVLLVAKAFGAYPQTQIKSSKAIVTLTNAAPDVSAIDVYIDHQLVKADLAATEATVYMQMAPGKHLIDVFPAGQNTCFIKTTELVFETGHMYQFILVRLPAEPTVRLLVLDERPALVKPDSLNNLLPLRVITGIKDAPPLNAYVNSMRPTDTFDWGDYRVFNTADGLVEIRMMFTGPNQMALSDRNSLWRALLDVYCLGRCSLGFPEDTHNG
jgi:uncharacterized protein DUF4397